MTHLWNSSRFAFLCGTTVLLLACTTLSGLAGSNPTTSADSDQELATQIDLWVAATVTLPSTNLELVTEYSDREPKKLSAEIDSAGNTHLWIKVPTNEAFMADQPPDAPLPGDFELMIVGGNAYTRIGGEGEAVKDNSYLTMLADTLNGPEGPGLWLSILPEEDYTPAGTESYGGFHAAKYTVDGQLEKGNVAGTVWVDNQSGALVGADLTVSNGLFFPPGTNRSGDVRITFMVQHTTVPTITLP
jgi:hypothetical protein